jgi:hypothetical protein
MMVNKYRPTKGAAFNAAQAQALGETIDKLGGHAKPEALVDAARPKSSPIHKLFEWDNTAAAEKYRVFQARNFINHLEIVVIRDSGPQSTKAFHSVVITRDKKSERGYCSLEMIVENEDLNAQVVRRALGELRYWKHKYAEYKSYPALAIVFSAIEVADKRHSRKKPARRRVVVHSKRRVGAA